MGYKLTSRVTPQSSKHSWDPKDSRSGVIYSYKCDGIICREEYIGQTARSLAERYKKHLKQPFPIHAHILQTGHNTTTKNFSIIGREDRDKAWTIKEAVYIRVNNPTLNRNVGKYSLSHLWDRVLFNTPGLKIGSSQYPLHLHNNSIVQTITANSQSPNTTGNSEHALNSEHVLRGT